MKNAICQAKRSDVSRMVELAEQKRMQYQSYQPTFWRKAADSRDVQLPFFEGLIAQGDVIALVHEKAGGIDGFLIATLVTAPPVYDPGGLTCAIDDFCVAKGTDWQTVGAALLAEAAHRAKDRGAVQAVVVCGHLDQSKRAMLNSGSFTIASEWYVRDV